MTILNDVRAALDNHLQSTPGVPSIAFQNVNFSPTTGQAYIKVVFAPTRIDLATVGGSDPQKRYTGFYSMLVCSPIGQGSGAGFAIADLLVSRFKPATDISFGGKIITINSVELGSNFYSPPFDCTPVNVFWHIYNA